VKETKVKPLKRNKSIKWKLIEQVHSAAKENKRQPRKHMKQMKYMQQSFQGQLIVSPELYDHISSLKLSNSFRRESNLQLGQQARGPDRLVTVGKGK